MAATAGAKPLEEGSAFLGQDDVADLVGLADTDRDGARVGIEVPDLQVGEFAVTRTGLQRRLHKRPEIRIAGVDQALGLGDRQITNPRRLDPLERFKPAAPGVAVADMTLIEDVVQRCLEYSKNAIGGGAAGADRLVADRREARCLRLTAGSPT
jgi:hypothetical protein